MERLHIIALSKKDSFLSHFKESADIKEKEEAVILQWESKHDQFQCKVNMEGLQIIVLFQKGQFEVVS